MSTAISCPPRWRRRAVAWCTLLASKGRDAIQAGPCFAAHSYTAGKEGSLGRVEGCFTAYLTDYSTFEHTVSLRALPSRYD